MSNIITKGNGRPIVVIVGSMHGDEPVGKKAIDEINKQKIIFGTLITIVANPKALAAGKRFIDDDLNRLFPGSPRGNYEQKIAAALSPILRQADYVLDIHSTTTNTVGAAIIKKKNKKVKKFLAILCPPKVVVMPKGIGDKSLVNFCNGVSLEYGRHHDQKTYKKSMDSILALLSSLGMIKEKTPRHKDKTEYYSVYEAELKPAGFKMNRRIKNFILVKKGDILGFVGKEKILAPESFYPVLFGPNSYSDIMGFKARRIVKV